MVLRPDSVSSFCSRIPGLAGALAVLSMGACQEIVPLGSECPGALACADDSGGDQPPPPPPPPMRDAEAGDAGATEHAPDAAVEPGSNFVIINPSFERSRDSLDGDLVLGDIADVILPDFLQVVSAMVPGWFACWPLSVTSNSQPIEGVKQPMGKYLSFVPSTFNLFDFVPVRQELKYPLKAGTTVHLVVDAISNGLGKNLYLEVRGHDDAICTPNPGDQGKVLGRSPIIPDSTDWKPVCVTFTADQDYSVLLLKPAAESALPPLGQSQPTLRLDNVRLPGRCP